MVRHLQTKPGEAYPFPRGGISDFASCKHCELDATRREEYLDLEDESMTRHRPRPRLHTSSATVFPCPSTPGQVSGKWLNAFSNIFSGIGRKGCERLQQKHQQDDASTQLVKSGVFQEQDQGRIHDHFAKLPASYSAAGFSPEQVKEHMDLLQQASRLKDGFVAFRMEVKVEDDASIDVSDSSCTSSAGGFSSLSSEGGSQVCKLDVNFACGTHICRPNLACALRQAGFSVVTLTMFDVSPRGCLGHFVARVYRDDFSKEVLDNVFCTALEHQKASSSRWLPPGVWRVSGEYMRESPIFERKYDSAKGGARDVDCSSSLSSPFRCHRQMKTSSAGDVEGMLQVLSSGERRGDISKADISKFILDPLKVELGPVVAVGASGEVRRGTYQGKDVAVKILKSSIHSKNSEAVVAEFRREVLTLMACGECSFLIKFYGIFVDVRSRMCIVTKFMEGGTLHSYLQQQNGKQLPMQKVIAIAKDVAMGMEFLHRNGITHRDLKSANVLLDGEGHAVVGDFGVARLKGERGEMTKEVGTYRWMAPEAFGTSAWPVTQKSDVYSFGIVLWELVSLALPFESYTPVQAAVAVTLNGLRPTIPATCPLNLRVLIERCWAKNPDDRPEFSEVVESLRKMSSTS